MVKKFLLTLVSGVFIIGCSTKPDPIVLDGHNSVSINQGILSERNPEIVLDRYLRDNTWNYEMLVKADKRDLIAENDRLKVFYLAHHSDEVKIIGKNSYAYTKHFKDNGVKAKISNKNGIINNCRDCVKISFKHKGEKR